MSNDACCVFQRKKVRVDNLLGGLRQESSEDALKRCLDKTVVCLQDMEHRYVSTPADSAVSRSLLG